MKTKKKATEFDIEVGKRVRSLREAKGLSQASLAEVLGTSFQQLQKNEKGINKFSYGAICLIAKHFGVSTDYFNNYDCSTMRLTDLVAKQTKKLNKIKRIIG